MEQQNIYIAEMNAEGQIEWVWMKKPKARIARPFKPAKDRFSRFEFAQFVGSKPEAILSWLATVQAERGARPQDHKSVSRKT